MDHGCHAIHQYMARLGVSVSLTAGGHTFTTSASMQYTLVENTAYAEAGLFDLTVDPGGIGVLVGSLGIKYSAFLLVGGGEP